MKRRRKYIIGGCILTGIILVCCLLLRIFVIDFYGIPSNSMQPTLQAGDYILVNKLYFGARLYRNLDFIDTGKEPETFRLKGYSSLKRNDIVVFNFPYREKKDSIRMNLHCFYVKRCIALPGDYLQINKGYYEVNGQRGLGNLQSQERLAHCKQLPEKIQYLYASPVNNNLSIQQSIKFRIPAKGLKIKLTPENKLLYHKQIVYEMQNEKTAQTDTTIYEFRHNWYFMAGDDVLNSYDSRFWGFLPEEYIIGKASLILTAKDPHTHQYRWTRFFTKL